MEWDKGEGVLLYLVVEYLKSSGAPESALSEIICDLERRSKFPTIPLWSDVKEKHSTSFSHLRQHFSSHVHPSFLPNALSLESNALSSNTLVHSSLRRPIYPSTLSFPLTHFHTLHGHFDTIYCLTVAKNVPLFATGADDKLLKVWSSENGALRFSLRGHVGEISDITFCNIGGILALISGDLRGHVRAWNIQTASPMKLMDDRYNIEGPNRVVSIYSLDERSPSYVVIIFDGGIVRMYRVMDMNASQGHFEVFGVEDCGKGTKVSCSSVWNFSESERIVFVAVGTSSGLIHIFKATERDGLTQVRIVDMVGDFRKCEVLNLEFTRQWNPRSMHPGVVTSCGDGTLCMIDPDDSQPLLMDTGLNENLPLSYISYTALCVCKIRPLIAVGVTIRTKRTSEDVTPKYSVHVLELKSLLCVANLETCENGDQVHTSELNEIMEHPRHDGIILASCTEGRVSVWDINQPTKAICIQFVDVFKRDFEKLRCCPISEVAWMDIFSPALDFMCADRVGAVRIFGQGNARAFEGIPVEQFLQTDRNEITVLDDGLVVDDSLDEMAHQCRPNLLCNVSREPYYPQPFASFFSDSRVSLTTAGLSVDDYEMERQRRERAREEAEINRDAVEEMALNMDVEQEYSDSDEEWQEVEEVDDDDVKFNYDEGDGRILNLRGRAVPTGVGDVDEEEMSNEEEYKVGRRRRRRRYIDSSDDEAEPDIPRKASAFVGFSWLHEIGYSAVQFVPQVGDEVVYLPSGHRAAEKNFPSMQSSLPYETMRSLPHAVFCKVVGMQYSRGMQHLVQCDVRLRMNGTLEEFSVIIRRQPGAPAFLMLASVFVDAMSRVSALSLSKKVHILLEDSSCALGGPQELHFAPATVVRRRSAQYTRSDPWEVVEVKWASGGNMFVNPWEVKEIISDSPIRVLSPSVCESVAEWIEREIESIGLEMFVDPPDWDRLPQYMNFVLVPMYLSLILNRLRSYCHYRSGTAVAHDLLLLATNARGYNPPETPFYESAEQLSELVSKEMRRTRGIFSDCHETAVVHPQHASIPAPSRVSETKIKSRIRAAVRKRSESQTATEHPSSVAKKSAVPRDEKVQLAVERRETFQAIANEVAVRDTRASRMWVNNFLKELEFSHPSVIRLLHDVVDKEEYPLYYKAIREPMFLSTVEDSARRRLYGDVESVAADLYLICANALTFNEPGSDIYGSALELLESADDAMESLGHKILTRHRRKSRRRI